MTHRPTWLEGRHRAAMALVTALRARLRRSSRRASLAAELALQAELREAEIEAGKLEGLLLEADEEREHIATAVAALND